MDKQTEEKRKERKRKYMGKSLRRSPSVPPDASPSVPPDASPSVPPDASPSVPPDASPSVPPDASPSVPPDASPVFLLSEILEKIFYNLPYDQVINCRLVCKQWKEVSDSEFLWKERCRREGFLSQDETRTPENWRMYYILCKTQETY
ncbi:hypothetical protein NQD34_005640 [Periophthalmus magnuspinnatus]|nr:hypothetical protein NQD34_005640 [Periophthalmus magnuspinnatus]